MIKKEKIFGDVSRMASGAVNMMTGASKQIQNEVRARVDEWGQKMDFVPREDFEKLELMVNDLAKKVSQMEKASDATPKTPTKKAAPKKKPAAKAATKKKPAAKTTAAKKTTAKKPVSKAKKATTVKTKAKTAEKAVKAKAKSTPKTAKKKS